MRHFNYTGKLESLSDKKPYKNAEIWVRAQNRLDAMTKIKHQLNDLGWKFETKNEEQIRETSLENHRWHRQFVTQFSPTVIKKIESSWCDLQKNGIGIELLTTFRHA